MKRKIPALSALSFISLVLSSCTVVVANSSKSSSSSSEQSSSEDTSASIVSDSSIVSESSDQSTSIVSNPTSVGDSSDPSVSQSQSATEEQASQADSAEQTSQATSAQQTSQAGTSTEQTSQATSAQQTSQASTSAEQTSQSTSSSQSSSSQSTATTSQSSSASTSSVTQTSITTTTTTSVSTSSSTFEEPIAYTVTWLDENGQLIRQDEGIADGEMPVFGSNPTKASTAQYDYVFAGWVPELAPVHSNVTYQATFDATIREYEITWVDYNNQILKSENVAYGNVPTFDGVPTREGDVQYSYVFAGWDKEVVAVTGPATYKATYSSSVNKYAITWLDYDNSELDVTYVAYGEVPVYEDTPTREGNAQYSYTFAGWDKEVVAVTGVATYKATYNETVNEYTVKWVDENDTVLKTESYAYGETPSYGGTPTKASNAQYSYSFLGWSPEVTTVTGNATYKATYSSTVNKYTVTWLDEDGSTLRTDTNVEYGTVPSYGTSPTKEADAQNTYTFDKWTPEITAVTGNVSYTASYTATPITNGFPDTVYFSNGLGWSDVYAYTWDSNYVNNATWPGVKMTDTGAKNEYNQGIYSISGMSNYDYIIFNNGSGAQTVDIAGADISTYNAYFISGSTNNEGKYQVGLWTYTPSQQQEDQAPTIDTTNKGLKILHCFDWSLATIKDNLDEIASQGFNAIQTSPLQVVKDYGDSYNDTNANWWRFYQPVSFSVANSTTNILFSSSDGDAELKELTSLAAAKGIRVIVDIVANHLANGSGNGGLHPSVASFEPEIYNDTNNTLHNWGAGSDASVEAIVKGDITGKDLNTSNDIVQRRVRDYLKELIDDGVTGFRFDAAKHIETSQDGYFASTFWENTLGQAKSYADDKNLPLFSYGEILSGNVHNRSYGDYVYHAWLNAVTDAVISEKWRQNDHTGFWTGVSEENNVIWGESHDEYCTETSATTTRYTGNDVTNNAYHDLALTYHNANMLYFPRPDFSAAIGGLDAHPDWGWKNSYIKEANLGH